MINLLKNKWSCTKLKEGGGGGSKNRILGRTRERESEKYVYFYKQLKRF